jgi:hypothetical protein
MAFPYNFLSTFMMSHAQTTFHGKDQDMHHLVSLSEMSKPNGTKHEGWKLAGFTFLTHVLYRLACQTPQQKSSSESIKLMPDGLHSTSDHVDSTNTSKFAPKYFTNG